MMKTREKEDKQREQQARSKCCRNMELKLTIPYPNWSTGKII